MENVPVSSAPQTSSPYLYYRESKISVNAVVVEASFGGGVDASNAGINNLYKGIAISAKQIVEKLNELLKAKLPNGVQSLKPEEVTPEATADKIVKGVTALYEAFGKQHPELTGEELINAFMEKVRSGVQKGYDEAFGILEGLGAFSFEGVKEGVETTKELIEQKLQAFERAKRQEMGLEPQDATEAVSDEVKSSLLSQAGAQVNVVA